MTQTKKTKSNVKISANTVVGSVYSQLVAVTITDTEATLDFVYIHPMQKSVSDPKDGQVVARITMPLSTSKSLAETIENTFKKHQEKKTK